MSIINNRVLDVCKVDTENGHPTPVGSMFYEENWSFEDARRILEQPGMVDIDFQFVDINKARMPIAWEKANRVSYYSGKLTIIQKLPPPGLPTIGSEIISLPESPQDAAPHPDDGEGVAAPHVGEQSAVSAPSADKPTDPNADFLSTCMPPELQTVWETQLAKLKQYLKFIQCSDHKWKILTWDTDGKAKGKIMCHECDCSFSGATKTRMDKASITNCFTNFRKKHLNTATHARFVAENRGNAVDTGDASQRSSATSVSDRATLDQHVQIVQSVND